VERIPDTHQLETIWAGAMVLTFLRRRKIVARDRDSNRDSSNQSGQITLSQLSDVGADVLLNNAFSY
jgi:hypothetical protein